MSINEYEMIYMIHQNDEKAFRMLLKKYNQPVYFIIIRYQKNRNKAWSIDDYLQLAMIKLMDAVYTYREDRDASFSSYFLEIFRRAIIDQFRKSISNKGIYEKTGYILDMNIAEIEGKYIECFAAPQVPLFFDEDIEKLKIGLEPMEKRIFNLRIRGYSYAQISAILKINIKKVDNTLTKIRKQKKKS